MSQHVTVIAATGAQQYAIASRFADQGWSVRGTSRKGATTGSGQTVLADPETGEGLEAALEGSDVVVLTLPQDHRSGAMPRIARTVAQAAEAAGVRRIVLNVAGTITDGGDTPLLEDMREARAAVTGGAVPWVVIQPTVFMDNLLAPWSLPSIAEQGVLAYPAPEAAPISWISHQSLAAYVYAAATQSEAVGRDLRIGGPEALSGVELCDRLSRRLDRRITYARIPLDGFAAGLDQAFGAPSGQRIASIYARLEDDPAALAVDPTETDFLGVTPESFSAFARRQNWTV